MKGADRYVIVVRACEAHPRYHAAREADWEGTTARCGTWIANDHSNSGRMKRIYADQIAVPCLRCFPDCRPWWMR